MITEILVAGIVGGIYFFPTIMAMCRRKALLETTGIAIANLALGWTGIVWIILLICACIRTERDRK